MNNKPVAWTDKRQLSKPYPHSDAMTMWANAYPEQGIDIPLYTHSVKEQLTDEEIKQAKLESWQQCKDTTEVIDFELSYQDELFARAILRKAQEK